MKHWLRMVVRLGACLLSLAGPAATAQAAQEVTVFAAASLTDVVGELARRYSRTHPVTVKTSFAASSTLARQIEAGAAADVFLSADVEWMDYLAERNLIIGDSRRKLLGNRLVLIAPAASAVQVKIRPGFDLAKALGARGRLAIGDPGSVPAGRYAHAALEFLGAWAGVENRLVPAENVRAALAFVAWGEAPLGVVYATDARAEPRVKVVDTFPPDSHPEIAYPMAVVRGAGPPAGAFAGFLLGAEARAAFENAGFTVLPR